MKQASWRFKDRQGIFQLKHGDQSNYLYFPLVNEAGMMSAITPSLHGSITSGHNTFLMEPISVESLHNSNAARNFWLFVEGEGAWSVSGNSAQQKGAKFSGQEEESEVEAGFLWHKLTRKHKKVGLVAETTSVVPPSDDQVELMKVKITNTSKAPITFTPTSVIPIYGRSADDLRDHRHVTSLLHRIYTLSNGITVKPTLSFDERGHRVNHTTYTVLGAEGQGKSPIGFFPTVDDFIGEGGMFTCPEAVMANIHPTASPGEVIEGYEAVGGLRFATVELQPGQSVSYITMMMIADGDIEGHELRNKYLSEQQFDSWLILTEQYWNDKLDVLSFQSGDSDYNLWLKWVTIQPILRRLYGNSFLPYHDYGRGGRGWRDLWQDCLALMVMEPAEVRSLLINNYAGVRIDGSNATIIGSQPGQFIADRNNIPRVWMDHGAWPLLTTLLYIHQSGDVDILLQPQTYFSDAFHRRCKVKDNTWNVDQGNQLVDQHGHIYKGTIIEHMILQNVTPFFHVGKHRNIKLEGADWNDGLDLGADQGESVAFTAFYASNLKEIVKLLLDLHDRSNVQKIALAEEMTILLDTLTRPIDYNSIEAKQALLERYYDSLTPSISGNQLELDIVQVANDLHQKSMWLTEHLRTNEWIGNQEGYSWYNGYYNNDAKRVEGDHPNGVRMTLTGQVFPIMGGVATDEQVHEIIAAVNRYLKDDEIGYRLNSNFGEIQQNLGRAFGFAFGHKENGAMFSHMTVMYANALYKRGFAHEGYAVLNSIYELSANFPLSRMYPGVPEYINAKGRGMYTYLTGSASWLLLTELTEVYGVKGLYGDLHLEPKLLVQQFDEEGFAGVETLFGDRRLRIEYKNEARLDYGKYQINKHDILLNGTKVSSLPQEQVNSEFKCVLPRALFTELDAGRIHTLQIKLILCDPN
jgi:cellobiose phosphorylase